MLMEKDILCVNYSIYLLMLWKRKYYEVICLCPIFQKANLSCGRIKTVWRHLNYHQMRSRRELEEVVKVLTFCCKENRWEVCFIGKGNRFQSTGDSRKMDLGWVKTTITTGNKSSSALDRAIWRGLLQKDGKPALLGPS